MRKATQPAYEKKLAVFPIMFGRAQALLGIVKSPKRGTGKSARAAKATKAPTGAAPAKRGRQTDATSKSGQIRELLKTDMSVADIAKQVGCTPALAYNVKARFGRPAKRGRGRPPKAKAAPAMAELDGIAAIVAAVQGSERDRVKMRVALERIQAVLAEVLA